MIKKIKEINMLKDWANVRVVLRDLGILPLHVTSNEKHISAAMEWLCRAQDVTESGGVSAGYSMYSGWRKPYPETTGYIIKTFLKYSQYSGNQEYLNRAVSMGDWEIDIQLSNGAVKGGVGLNNYPIVFNTGQVILGWTDLYVLTKEERFKNSAVKAANWLTKIQEDDGKWSKHVYLDIPHSYHTEVSWSLLEVYKITGNIDYFNAAEKQIQWTLSNAKENGWFGYASFSKDRLPITHTIGYTLQGLLESSVYFEKEFKDQIERIVLKACENITLEFEKRQSSRHKYLPASFDSSWQSPDNYSCLTGNCQLAIVLVQVYKLFGDSKLLDTSMKILDQVKMKQSLNSSNDGIRGGISGSYPIWGKYQKYNYPNWAAKYFVDSLLLQEEVLDNSDSKKLKELDK